MDYKEELIHRVKFLIENAMYLIKPMNKKNILNLYLFLENNENDLLKDIENFLLSDNVSQNSNLFTIINSRKNDKDYLLMLKDNKDYIMDSFTLLSIIRKFITRERIFSTEISCKLNAIDEYFRILRYENNEYTYISGAVLEPIDIRNHIKIESGIIDSGFYDNKKINGTKVYNSKFIEFINNRENYHNNSSILTEEEKQKIYLSFHDVIPWNAKGICNKSDLFFCNHYCEKDFYLKEEEIFYYNNKYYMMCPNCYNITIIDDDKLSNAVKKRIQHANVNDKIFLRNIFYKREYLINEKKKILKK